MLLTLPGVGVIDASEEQAPALLAAGWKPAEAPKKTTLRRRTTRKAAPKKTE